MFTGQLSLGTQWQIKLDSNKAGEDLNLRLYFDLYIHTTAHARSQSYTEQP